MGKFDRAEYSTIDDIEERAKVFARAMWMIWVWPLGGRLSYLTDYSRIAAFLSHKQLFEATFKKVDADLDRSFDRSYLTTKSWFTTTCRDLFTQYGSGGFVPGENIVMVGSAFKIFGPIVNAGYLFKDGTGPDHGEYTHTLQWLTVARAACDGVLRLEHSVTDLYKASTAAGSYSSNGKSVGVKIYAPSPKAERRYIGLWEYLVDCFPDPEGEENLVRNILSATYRTPSELMSSLRRGPLYFTFVSIWLEIREEERGWIGEKRNKEMMRDYHTKKQPTKNKVVSFEEGFNTFFPRDLNPKLKVVLGKRGMKW